MDTISTGANVVLAKWVKGIFGVEKMRVKKGRGGRGNDASIGKMKMVCLCFFRRGWEKVEGKVGDA